MGTRANPGEFDCYARALPDEPLFTLLARDASAPGMVRQWAYEREREIAAGDRPEADRPMVAEARACAVAMEKWRLENAGAWKQSLVPRDPIGVILDDAHPADRSLDTPDAVLDERARRHG